MEKLNKSTAERVIPRIDLFFTPAAVTNERLKGYTTIVIDVLRAATSITMALSNGAKDVIPAESTATAIKLAGELNRDDVLLCGERDGKLVEGFDIGNSPADYTRDRVRGRTLIFATTNGTPSVIRASVAKSLFLCGFINLNAVVDAIMNLKNPFPLAVLCAGKRDSFAMEDVVCGGLVIERLMAKFDAELRLNDAGKAATVLYREFGGDILSMLRRCNHGEYLIEIGFENDLPICASDSILLLAPELSEGRFNNPTS